MAPKPTHANTNQWVPRIPPSSGSKEVPTTTGAVASEKAKNFHPWELVTSPASPSGVSGDHVTSSKEVLLPLPLGWCQEDQGCHHCLVVTRPLPLKFCHVTAETPWPADRFVRRGQADALDFHSHVAVMRRCCPFTPRSSVREKHLQRKL